jgi:hypothetical protein
MTWNDLYVRKFDDCMQVQEIEKVKEVLVKVQEEAVIDKQQLQVEVIKARQEVVRC